MDLQTKAIICIFFGIVGIWFLRILKDWYRLEKEKSKQKAALMQSESYTGKLFQIQYMLGLGLISLLMVTIGVFGVIGLFEPSILESFLAEMPN